MLRAQPNTYCIILAEHGSELSAVRALKSGAKDYLPLARVTPRRPAEGRRRRLREASAPPQMAPEALLAPAGDTPSIQVPGYTIVKEIATSNFSSVYLARSTGCAATSCSR